MILILTTWMSYYYVKYIFPLRNIQTFVFFVLVPHVRIQGSPDIHVDQGSVINLTCIISYSPEPPVYVFWYKGESVSISDQSHIFLL